MQKGKIDFLIDLSHGCYDGETEVLTNSGWKLFNDVSSSDRFLTLNISNNKSEYQYATEFHKYKHTGEMHLYKSVNVDLLVTPDHNFFVVDRWKLSRSIKKSSSLTQNFSLPLCGYEFGGIQQRTVTIGDVEYDALDFCKFVGFYLGDGSVYHNSKDMYHKKYRICFKFKRERKIKYLCELLDKIGIEYGKCVVSSGCTEIDISNVVLADYFRKIGDVKCVPVELLCGGLLNMEGLYNGLMNSDGCVNVRGCSSFCSASRRLADDFCHICAKLGYMTRVSTRTRSIKMDGRIIVSTIHDVSIKKKFVSIKQFVKFRKIVTGFDDFVYCVSVPNKVLMVRRGGVTSWCGNSSGKGNIAAMYGMQNDYDVCISNNGINAGHSIMYNGVNEVVKVVPTSGIFCKDSNVIIGSGAAFTIEKLLYEIEHYDLQKRILISSHIPIINEYCIEYEKEHLQYIASTFQGVGAAHGLKAMRSQKIKLAKDYPELEKYVHHHIPDVIINRIKDHGHSGFCEIAQGYGLSVDSEFYPYTTSRNVSVGQALSYLDVPVTMVGDVIGIARSYPIRVGNVPNGHSGEMYPDSKELSWDWMSNKLGKDVLEMTSVTKRVRRVFEFSKIGFEMAVRRNGVNVIFISFCDYLLKSEQDSMADYLKSSKFNFKEIYFVHGYWDHSSNVVRVA